MKKNCMLLLAVCGLFTIAAAQPAKKKTVKKPVAKTAVKKTKPKPVNRISLEMLVMGEDSSFYTEALKTGDQLVYEVNAGGSTYDFTITLINQPEGGGIEFSYEMTNENKTKGHVVISADAMQNARSYVNFFGGGELALSNACTVWMTGANFADMPVQKTDMVLDGGAPETFYRPDNDVVRPEILLHGKKVVLDGFKINNAADGSGDKTWWIQNTSANSLILKMDLGWTVQLKEIR